MTEGPNELAFFNVLLQKNLLIFSKEDMLMEQAFHKRQIDGELKGYIQGLPINDTVDIYRIGDQLTDNLKIPHSILSKKIRKQHENHHHIHSEENTCCLKIVLVQSHSIWRF